ncbi:MAG TPA: sensor histidine kinase [Bryobacteraceae bacterium]|nr:sensor histidine kinase [Bryobacteraceae bacterium]
MLFAGFGGLLAFLIASAAVTFYMLDRVRNDDRRFRQTFVERLGALERIRAQIYLSGTYVRDYLLSPDSGADAQRARLAAIEEETQEVLNRYAKGLEPGERDVFEALRSEIGNYWSVLHTAFDWTPRQRDRLRFSFFYEQLVPRRTTMLQIADTIESIHQRGLTRAEERFAASAGNLRLSLMAMYGLALSGSLLLALGAIAVTLRLERENAQARAGLEDLSARLVRTQEEERRSLARELHDEVGQSLSAIMMEAGNAEFAESPEEMRDRVRAIVSMAEKTLSEVRDLALLLRPSMLDDFGLVPALNWQAREMSKRTGLNIAVEAGEDCDSLPEEHRTCIYRMAQEALNNVARHAEARSARVIVRKAGNRVLFSVRDDGSGFDKKVVRGLGLLGMEERVRSLGGGLKIDSQPGRGTTISAELPLSEAVAREAHAAADPHPVG